MSIAVTMAPSTDSSIRVPSVLRDRIRQAAARRGLKQAELLERALRELEQADFLRQVAATTWDDAALAEAKAWDDADLVSNVDPWAAA